MPQSESLDQRRPRFLRDLVGNPHVFSRLSHQMMNGTVPNRAFIFGPTGAGKTTLARIIARHFFCQNRIGFGDSCGTCQACLKELSEISDYEQWTAARLGKNWEWWEKYGLSILHRQEAAFFLDESQDLNELHQKDFYDQLESATALVIFATTHKNSVKEALLNRFGANVYELRRPTPEEAVKHMQKLCRAKNVQALNEHLARVVELYGCDLRKCVDFVYCAHQQARDGVVTEQFIDDVFGVPRPISDDAISQPKSMLKL